MKVAIVLSILLLLNASSFAQWVQTSGPSGGGVSDFATNGPTIFASSLQLGNGVYASTDNGESWHESGLQGMMLSHITANGNTLLTSSTQNSYNETDTIYRSSDGGATWQVVLSIPNINGITSICLYQQRTWIISSSGEGGKFFMSTDDGITWNFFQPAWDYSNPIPIVANNNVLIAGVNLGGVPYIEMSTANDPTLWLGQIRIDSLSQLTCATVSGNTIWFGGGGGVIFSNDGGVSWGHPANNGLENKRLETISTLSASGDHLIAISSLNNVYYSWDRAGNWTKITGNGLPENVSNFFSVYYSNDSYYLGSSSGIIRSQDEGAHWLYSTSGLRCADILGLTTFQNKIFVATEKGVASSADHGITWSDAGNTIQLQDTTIIGFFTNGADFFAYGQGLYSWNSAWGAVDSNKISAFTESGTGRLFIARNGLDPIADTSKLFISDKGADWQATLSFANSIDTEFNFLSNCLSAHDQVILAANRSLRYLTYISTYFISRSTDNGISWVTTPIPYAPTFITFVDGSFYMGTSENGLFQSPDNGITWDPIGFNSKSGVNSFLKIGAWLFASVTGNGSTADGLFWKGNDGAGWRYANGGTTNIAGALTADDKFLYSGGPSIWKRSLADFGINDVKNNSKIAQSLEIYPNPAIDIIHIHIPDSFLQGTLLIYDEKGLNVKQEFVSNENQGFSLTTNGLIAGIFYLRLLDKSGHEIANSKFVHIRN